jgi:hypothetical protein
MNAVKTAKNGLGIAMAVPAQEILSKEFGQGLVLGRLLGESQTEFKWGVTVSADHPLAKLGINPRAVLRKKRGEWLLELRHDLSTKQDRKVTASRTLRLRSAGKTEEANNLAGKARDVVCLDKEEVQALVSRLSPLAVVRSGLRANELPAAWSEQGRSIRSGRVVVKATDRGFLIFKSQGVKPVFARTAAKAVQLIVGRTADEQLLAEVTAAAAK